MILYIASFPFAYMLIVCFFCFCFCFYCFFLLENKCKFAAYIWLQIFCINTLFLINSSFSSCILIADQLQPTNIKFIVQLHYKRLTYHEC